MVSFWQTIADLGGQKLRELGAVGMALGAIWIVGIWVWYDLMRGAYVERLPETASYFMVILAVWLIVGAAIYLLYDPHGIRSGRAEGLTVKQVTEDKSD